MTTETAANPILNRHVPCRPWRLPRANSLPGIVPIDVADWLWQLDSYAGQMKERERLLAECPEQVLALLPEAKPAARELLEVVLSLLEPIEGFTRSGDTMRCPDGREVALDRTAPLRTLARLVQEDLCLLLKRDGSEEHLLAGAALCFPASWTLAEKLGRPMLSIHMPVDVYDARLAQRVQRLLDGVQPGRPLSRCNALFYDDPALFQPRPENNQRPAGGPRAPFFRSERQCLLRLPESGAVVFSIHTILMRREDLEPDDMEALEICKSF